MTVHIEIQEERLLLNIYNFSQQMLGVVYRWVQYLGGIFAKFTVQVTPSEVAAVVPVDHAVYVKHWNYIEVKMVF